jgi:hypothetical protein
MIHRINGRHFSTLTVLLKNVKKMLWVEGFKKGQVGKWKTHIYFILAIPDIRSDTIA